MDYRDASKKIRDFARTLVPAEDPELAGSGTGPHTVNSIVNRVLIVAWCDAVRDVWESLVAANPQLKSLHQAAKAMMVQEGFQGDPICAPLGMKLQVANVGGQQAVSLEHSLILGTPLSAIFTDKAQELMDAAKQVPPIITSVYSFGNGQTMVFDQFGKQMPDFQGATEEVVPKIKEAGYVGEITACKWKPAGAEC